MTPRYALVTGASRGIGAAIARRLAAEGYALTITARHETALRAVAAQVAGAGAAVHRVTGDMALEDDVRRVASEHLERFPALHVLVLNAGMAVAGELASYPLRRLDQMLAINLRAPFALVQACLPALREAALADPDRGAKVVAIASMSGVVSERQLAAYGATKAALISLCQSISVEESRHGVSATAISPGYVDTDMGAWASDRIDPSAMLDVADVAEMAVAVTRLSARAVVPHLVLARAGESLWRA
ncbi:MAG TPA: SDR family oxidoreductase [Acidimicrobiales bacterium]|nr:SDR family oxidoreductase [Acidimicrobiales bacterium]